MMAGEAGSAMSAYQQWDAVSTQYILLVIYTALYNTR